MAEQYEPGKQRIYYRAGGFGTDVVVKVYFIDPDLKKSPLEPITLTQVDKVNFPGLYYFEYDFLEGNYVAYFYEDTGRQLYYRLEIRWASGVNIDHGTTKTVIERKGDATFPIERTSEINEPFERGS